jgi:hypothetical protein
MIITVDNFSYTSNSGQFLTYIISYNTDNNTFSYLFTSNNPRRDDVDFLTVAQRGKQDGQLIGSNCNGTTQYAFYASLRKPFATVIIERDSTDCGFVAPLPPPPPTPPPPPPVCDLFISATSTQLTGLNRKDGTVSVELLTTNVGNAFIELIKGGTVVNGTVIDLSVSNTFTFGGLTFGDYIIRAGLIDFDCEDVFGITVLDAFFNEIYSFNFCEIAFDNRPIKISIKKLNYSGTSTVIKDASAEVISIKHETGSEYKFETILGSSCDVNLISESEFQFADLFISEEKEYLIEVFYNENELFWTGYVTGDRAIEPFDGAPYVTTISALDGIKLLKDVDFDIVNSYTTFLEAIKYILDKTDLVLPFKTMVDFQDNTLNVDYKVLTGLECNVYGNNVVVNDGTGVVNGTLFNITGGTFAIDPLPSGVYDKTYYLLVSSTSVYLSTTFDNRNFAVLLVAIVNQSVNGIEVVKTRYYNGDVLNDHLFNTNVFQKENGDFTDCLTVLEFICRQFTCSAKQESGYWVIENIGAKARLNTTQYTYDNDLVLQSTDIANLSIDVDCSQNINDVLSGGDVSLITGDKQATVFWKLGFPAPVFKNFNFEDWFVVNGAEIPSKWQISQPYGWFNKSPKFDRIYDPTTGILTEVENGSYYFNIKKNNPLARIIRDKIKSTSIVVFNREVINLTFQVIFTNRAVNASAYELNCTPRIGNYICVNKKDTGADLEPVWILDDGQSYYAFTVSLDNTKNIPFGDESNVNITFPPCPVQGQLTIEIDVNRFIFINYFAFFGQSIVNVQGLGQVNLAKGASVSDIGFDNFKVSKSNPVTNATIIDDATIIVLNDNKFSNTPEDFNVLMGDVDSDLRTDGIRTLNYLPTVLWSRVGVTENEALNNIVCKELLSQYQNNTRIFEGSILAKEQTVRNIFNLPLLDLFRFVPISFDYDMISCISSVKLVEVYDKDGNTSGSIGGGSGGGQNQQPDGYILASKNLIFTDGNDNILKSE